MKKTHILLLFTLLLALGLTGCAGTKAEAPKAEAPKADAPKTEAPKADAPKTEAPKAEAPKTEAPKAEAPKAEAPKAEAPKAEAPKTEAPKPEVKTGNKVGSKAFEFTFKDTKGDDVSLSDFKGKTVLMAFFASWCGPCKTEAPILKEMHAEYKDKDVVVIGLNIAFNDERKKADEMISSMKLDYKILFDEKGETTQKYGVSGIPTVFVIDKNGIITFKHSGVADKATLVKEVEKAMTIQ